jgi:NRPS condensation-like uncharacterized protein
MESPLLTSVKKRQHRFRFGWLTENNVVQRWESEMERELSIPFNARQAPLVRAVLLHEADRAVCILVAHHSIADGLSIAFAIRDLLQALSGNPIALLPVIPAHEEILGITGGKASQAAPSKESNATPAIRPAIYRKKEDSRPRIKSLYLTPELTGKLRERARQEGTTVDGALSSALAHSAANTIRGLRGGRWKALRRLPVSLRPAKLRLCGSGSAAAFSLGLLDQ